MIFFFKQKTAYEMRIIDWSSDVCSSDLKEMRTEAIRRVRGYKDPLFVETRADARILEAELQLREVQAKRLAARTLLASFWGGIAEGLVISEGIEKPDPRDPPLAEARSEEHTSELQSLMRTSYAVSCWKQKNHITCLNLRLTLRQRR